MRAMGPTREQRRRILDLLRLGYAPPRTTREQRRRVVVYLHVEAGLPLPVASPRPGGRAEPIDTTPFDEIRAAATARTRARRRALARFGLVEGDDLGVRCIRCGVVVAHHPHGPVCAAPRALAVAHGFVCAASVPGR